MSSDKPPLERRLREALHAEAREHPLGSDFITSVEGSLPHRDPAHRGLLRLVLPSLAGAAAVLVVAAYAVFNLRPQSPISTTGSPSAPASSAPTPLPPGPDIKFAGLVDANNGWALTSTGLFFTADGGTTWRSANVPGPQTGRGVLGVGFADASHGWLATLDSADAESNVFDVWRTDDGARSWQKVVVPEGANRSDAMGPVEFSILDADHLFLIVEGGMPSGYTSDLYESTDGGRSWSADRLTGEPGVTGPVAFADSQHGVIAGGAPGNRLFVTANGGRSWGQVAIPVPAGMDPTYTEFFNAPQFWDARRGALAVTYGTEVRSMELGILLTNDAGASWSLAGTIPAQSNDVPVAFLSPDEWLTMPNTTTRLRTTDGGKTWVSAPAKGLPGAQSLFFADADNGWALVQLNVCLSFKSDCHSRTGLYGTSDGGATWTALWPR